MSGAAGSWTSYWVSEHRASMCRAGGNVNRDHPLFHLQHPAFARPTSGFGQDVLKWAHFTVKGSLSGGANNSRSTDLIRSMRALFLWH